MDNLKEARENYQEQVQKDFEYKAELEDNLKACLESVEKWAEVIMYVHANPQKFNGLIGKTVPETVLNALQDYKSKEAEK